MSDSNQTLGAGLGKPIFTITDRVNNQILVENAFEERTLSPLSNYVKSFSYDYDEENDDKCVIVLGFEKVSQLNNPIFVEDNILKVQWGYVLPGNIQVLSPARTIAIREISPSYTKSGITLTLECTDLVSYLRRSRLNLKSDSNNFVDWLKEIVNDEFTAAIRVKNEVLYIDKQQSRAYEKTDDGQIFAIDNARSFKELFIAVPDTLIGGKSKSITAELQERLNTSKDGPAYLDGRDANINIIIRDYNQAPWVTYTLAGGFGEIVSFRASSNIQKVKEDGAQTSTINPLTKEIETTEINTASTDPDGSDPTPAQLENMYLQFREIWEYNILNPTDMKPIDTITYKKAINIGPHASPSNTDQNTSVYIGFANDLKITVAAKTILNMPGFIKEQKEAIARNYLERKIQRKFEAVITVVGDPSLITSKVYEFLGLGLRDSGSWYAVKVKHDISIKKGYTCTITAVRKPKLLGIQYLKRTIKILTVEDAIRLKVLKEVTEERRYEEEKDTKVNDNPTRKLKIAPPPKDKFEQSLDRLEILKAEDTYINSPENLSQEVDKSKGVTNPNVDDV